MVLMIFLAQLTIENLLKNHLPILTQQCQVKSLLKIRLFLKEELKPKRSPLFQPLHPQVFQLLL